MITVINDQIFDPYKNDLDYQLVRNAKDITINGVLYEEEKVYEKKLDLLTQIGQIFYALLVTLAVIPMVCYPDYFGSLWKDAARGVERQVVLLKSDLPVEGEVAFGELRVREFNADKPPAAIANIVSTVADLNITSGPIIELHAAQITAADYANATRDHVYLDKF